MSEIDWRRRRELRRHWQAFIDGQATAPETAAWAQAQLADYGDEEIIHQGLQRLNGHSWQGNPANAATWRSYHDWLEIVHWYDDDPVAWNFNYWRNFCVAMVRSSKPGRADVIALGFSTYLDEATIRSILETYAPRN